MPNDTTSSRVVLGDFLPFPRLNAMPKILIAECKQEVSTFNPNLSSYDDFTIRKGEAILRYHRSVGNEVGGALNVFDEQSVEVVPAYSACFIT